MTLTGPPAGGRCQVNNNSKLSIEYIGVEPKKEIAKKLPRGSGEA